MALLRVRATWVGGSRLCPVAWGPCAWGLGEVPPNLWGVVRGAAAELHPWQSSGPDTALRALGQWGSVGPQTPGRG